MRVGCFTTRNILVGTTYIQIHMVNEGWVGGGGCSLSNDFQCAGTSIRYHN